jgi:hypothetical protein
MEQKGMGRKTTASRKTINHDVRPYDREKQSQSRVHEVQSLGERH